MSEEYGAGAAGGLSDQYSSTEDQLALVQCLSPTSSCSGPEGFKNRKVELKDGFLVVSEELGRESPCTSIMGNWMEEWENVYLKHREDIIEEDGFIVTPLHIIKEFGKAMKMEVNIEHFILKGAAKNSRKIYRVDILFGPLIGVGQCSRKQLARQLAAIDLYEKIYLKYSNQKNQVGPMPRSALLPGWRVESLIYPILFNSICKEKNLQTPKFKLLPPPDNKPGKFTSICSVGDIVTQAEHDFPWLAKRLAAKKMYEQITGEDFPMRTTLTGSDVIDFPRMKLLGFNPKITNMKRKWMMAYRIKDTQVVHHPNEPDDGDMDELEEEAQMQLSKKLKLNEMKGTLRVTFGRGIGRGLKHSKDNYRTVTSIPNEQPDPPVRCSTPHPFSDVQVLESQFEEDDDDDCAYEDQLVINADEDDEFESDF